MPLEYFKVLLTPDLSWPKDISRYRPEKWCLDRDEHKIIRTISTDQHIYKQDAYTREQWTSNTINEVISLHEMCNMSEKFWETYSIRGSILVPVDDDLQVILDFTGWTEFDYRGTIDIPQEFLSLYDNLL